MKTAILLPAYKRPEYTQKCVRALEDAQEYPETLFMLVDDGSNDATAEIFVKSELPKNVVIHYENRGLRNVLIDFIEWVRLGDFELLGVIGNDCVVPKDWLTTIERHFRITTADILSPNVFPSNAAFKFGKEDTEGLGYRPSKIVGGLWYMRRDMIEGISFDRFEVRGIKGAFNILDRIIIEKDPKIGWVTDVVVQDLGHWSGQHPEHIKSEPHRQYYEEVGRRIVW